MGNAVSDEDISGKIIKQYSCDIRVFEITSLHQNCLNCCARWRKIQYGVLICSTDPNAKLSIDIKQEDFKADPEYLTQFILNPRVTDGAKSYKLCFTGHIKKVNDKLMPVSGKLHIDDVFQYEGKWVNGKVNGKGLLYNVKDQTYEEVHHADGIRLKNKQDNKPEEGQNRDTAEEGQS